MLRSWRKEREVRRVLRGLARQRVATVLEPGGVWVIELALERDKETEAHLQTCLMRGWVEVLKHDMGMGTLKPDGGLPEPPFFTQRVDLFRLTEGGWAALNRAHAWTLASILVGIAGVIVTIVLAK